MGMALPTHMEHQSGSGRLELGQSKILRFLKTACKRIGLKNLLMDKSVTVKIRPFTDAPAAHRYRMQT